MSRDGHTALFRSVLVLPVAALLYYQAPAIPLHQLDRFAYFHPKPPGGWRGKTACVQTGACPIIPEKMMAHAAPSAVCLTVYLCRDILLLGYSLQTR